MEQVGRHGVLIVFFSLLDNGEDQTELFDVSFFSPSYCNKNTLFFPPLFGRSRLPPLPQQMLRGLTK